MKNHMDRMKKVKTKKRKIIQMILNMTTIPMKMKIQNLHHHQNHLLNQNLKLKL
jgi:hypothetical protein